MLNVDDKCVIPHSLIKPYFKILACNKMGTDVTSKITSQ